MTERYFHEDLPDLDFLDEVEAIDPFDDILDDGREPEKHRTLMDAYEAYREAQHGTEEGSEE
jgi:hypothetical protein